MQGTRKEKDIEILPIGGRPRALSKNSIVKAKAHSTAKIVYQTEV